jgi:hypothetical protein
MRRAGIQDSRPPFRYPDGYKKEPMGERMPKTPVGKEVSAHQRGIVKNCIFCGGGRSKTHIWPNWLNRLYPEATRQHFEVERHVGSPTKVQTIMHSAIKQGNLFSQKPYLACIKCNTGWMKQFEDEVLTFIKPIIAATPNTHISDKNIKILCGWIMLIIILAEFTIEGGVSVSSEERDYLRSKRKPPENWAIFCATSTGPYWHKAWTHHTHAIREWADVYDSVSRFGIEDPANTQVTSLGIGHLFIHAFSCPNWRIVRDFEIAARARGLVQLWPPRRSFWPFSKGGTKFPTKLVLSDDDVDMIESAFSERLKITFNLVEPTKHPEQPEPQA